MFTADALLWRFKYFVALLAVFATTSFAPAHPACGAAAGAPTSAPSVEASPALQNCLP